MNTNLQNARDDLGTIVIEHEDQERKSILELFRGGLVNVLEAESDGFKMILDDYNDLLMIIFLKDRNFQKEVESSIYNNLEKLTHGRFIKGGKSHAPNIRNWVYDFIEKKGSGLFDNVVLTDYVTGSDNCKDLNKDEQKLVQKLLVLYRNVKFFPLHFEGLPEDDWEIIPVEREGEELGKIRTVGVPRTAQEKEIETLKNIEAGYARGGLEQLVIEEEIGKKKSIEELEIMAKKYPAGSLEHKVIAEEIGKLAKR